jgi:hypothetical protein
VYEQGDAENCVMSSDTTCDPATCCWDDRINGGRERERDGVKYRVHLKLIRSRRAWKYLIFGD